MALAEPQHTPIHYENRTTFFSHDPARDVRFTSFVPYQIVLLVGRNPIRPIDQLDLNENVIAEGNVIENELSTAYTRWFKVGLYVPDAYAMERMTPSTLAHYKSITGRGPKGPSYCPYWVLSGWERAGEFAKMVGSGVGTVLKLGRPLISAAATGGTVTPTVHGPARELRRPGKDDPHAGNTEAGVATYARSFYNGTVEDFNRKQFVPPGYVFVKYSATLSVKVVGVNLKGL